MAAQDDRPLARGRWRAWILATLGSGLVLAFGLSGAAAYAVGRFRLPDRAEVISTNWGAPLRSPAPPFFNAREKADVKVRLSRRDGLPITSRFFVLAYGGQVVADAPSEPALLASADPNQEAIRPAAGWWAREVVVTLEMIPTQPGSASGDLVVLNDAPGWKHWPEQLERRFGALVSRQWSVDLPKSRGAPATITPSDEWVIEGVGEPMGQ